MLYARTLGGHSDPHCEIRKSLSTTDCNVLSAASWQRYLSCWRLGTSTAIAQLWADCFEQAVPRHGGARSATSDISGMWTNRKRTRPTGRGSAFTVYSDFTRRCGCCMGEAGVGGGVGESPGLARTRSVAWCLERSNYDAWAMTMILLGMQSIRRGRLNRTSDVDHYHDGRFRAHEEANKLRWCRRSGHLPPSHAS